MCIITNKKILITVANLEIFPTLLLDDRSLALFLVNSSIYLIDIIQALGDQFCGLFGELLVDISPRVSQILLSRSRRSSSFTQEEYNELYLYLGKDNNDSVDIEEFIRPFHDDRDNRNGYKGKIESVVYNEREKCFDEFSNLFRKYCEISRSDLDGSKTEDFWPYLTEIGEKVSKYIYFFNLLYIYIY